MLKLFICRNINLLLMLSVVVFFWYSIVSFKTLNILYYYQALYVNMIFCVFTTQMLRTSKISYLTV